MAVANSQTSLVGLDFDTIKTNLKQFLGSQDTLKDYNFEGSALSILLEVLAYNTQYNAFYLNMVSNEMFMDTALQRPSVVSHAKLLNYVPKSAKSPTAFVDITVNNVIDPNLVLPLHTNFLSESVDGVNYNFVTTDSHTADASNNTVTFSNIEIKQGISVDYSFIVDSTSNPNYTFELPDNLIDTSTIIVKVQQSTSNSYTDLYTISNKFLTLDTYSQVYFLQEGINGNYEIYFGDGILGKKLTDGNVVKVSYVVTQGTSAYGANNFVLMDSISGYTNVTVNGKSPATKGGEKESIDSIKFQAPKSYASQGRGVTKNDYISIIQQNDIGLQFDAVNVWGGEENDPPAYGQVFVCVKPSGAYSLTQTQKKELAEQVIKPFSVLTVTPTVIDPDYTYIQVESNVIFNPTKTNLTQSQLREQVKTAIFNFGDNTLNSFDSTFMASELTSAIKGIDPSIITNEISIKLQKKFYPNLSDSTTYTLDYGTKLKRGMFQSTINSYPSVQYRDPINLANTVNGIYIEEIPSATGGVESIAVINPGFGYQYPPTVEIIGDGTGATAKATINTSGQIRSINVTSKGTGYTSALAIIKPSVYDKTGKLGAALITLEGRYGTLRSFYNDSRNAKTVFNANIGTIDYTYGIIKLNAFSPIQVDNPLGQLTISVEPESTIISSTYNKIITIDSFDPNAVIVNVIAKT